MVVDPDSSILGRGRSGPGIPVGLQDRSAPEARGSCNTLQPLRAPPVPAPPESLQDWFPGLHGPFQVRAGPVKASFSPEDLLLGLGIPSLGLSSHWLPLGPVTPCLLLLGLLASGNSCCPGCPLAPWAGFWKSCGGPGDQGTPLRWPGCPGLGSPRGPVTPWGSVTPEDPAVPEGPGCPGRAVHGDCS